MKKPQIPQKLVMFRHAVNNLFYIGSYNYVDEVKFQNSSSITSNYNRAKFIYNNLMKSDGSFVGMQSGFMMALVNTNFDGWTRIEFEKVYPNAVEAADGKEQSIDVHCESGITYVGSDYRIIKGVYGNGKVPPNWTRKWNINAMKQSAIREKIDFICRSINTPIPATIYTDAYMAVVAPERFGPRMKNYGSYEINCLATLFRFVRQYMDLDNTNAICL